MSQVVSIEWTPKGHRVIPPVERARFERGEAPRRLEGTFKTGPEGHVFYCEGEHRALVGFTGGPLTNVSPVGPASAEARNLGAVAPAVEALHPDLNIWPGGAEVDPRNQEIADLKLELAQLRLLLTAPPKPARKAARKLAAKSKRK